MKLRKTALVCPINLWSRVELGVLFELESRFPNSLELLASSNVAKGDIHPRRKRLVQRGKAIAATKASQEDKDGFGTSAKSSFVSPEKRLEYGKQNSGNDACPDASTDGKEEGTTNLSLHQVTTTYRRMTTLKKTMARRKRRKRNPSPR